MVRTIVHGVAATCVAVAVVNVSVGWAAASPLSGSPSGLGSAQEAPGSAADLWGSGGSAKTCTNISDADVAGLFDRWNEDLISGDPARVAENYADDSILLPTVSAKVRFTQEQREDYFAHWLEQKPSGVVNKRWIERDCNYAVDSGIYTFTYADGSVAPARYTFVYGVRDGEWKILTHHSSAMPKQGAETGLPPATQSEGSPEVRLDPQRCAAATSADIQRELTSWVDAVEAGDPALVAEQYSLDSVLLAADSNEMMLTTAEKERYFTEFLAAKPKVTVDDHWTHMDCNAATDSGLYTFTKADGTVTKARFTSTYRLNGDSWEITSQHSSVLPEQGH